MSYVAWRLSVVKPSWRVASVPGVAYGLSPCFRISTTTSEEVLTDAIAQINAAVALVE